MHANTRPAVIPSAAGCRRLVARTLMALAALSCTAARAEDDALYRELGGQPALVILADDLVARLLADARMAPFFKDADLPRLSRQLAIQFCEVSGGPCRLQGKDRDMKKLHEGVDIGKADFNALVEVLQQAMDAQGIAFRAQNRLLAKLAPMHRDIVNVR